ncbi:MAG: hypothetical protein ACOYEF_01415 [Planifilum sp.]|jgi:hypothetical protein
MYGRRWKIWRYTIFALIGVGLLSVLSQKPGGILFPLLLVGVIYLLYKHPPRWLMRFVYPSHPYQPKRVPPRQRKRPAKGRPHLRVIKGKGPKNPGDKASKSNTR